MPPALVRRYRKATVNMERFGWFLGRLMKEGVPEAAAREIAALLEFVVSDG